MNEAAKALIEKRFHVHSDGFVELLDVMGDDYAVTGGARLTAQTEGKKSEAEERGLIRYLLRHVHTTPYELCEVKFRLRVEMDTWRQWIRHRTANVNEYSTRYSEAIDSNSKTDPKEWRLQATTNRQGSSGEFLKDWPAGVERGAYDPGMWLTEREKVLHDLSREIYEERLQFGVAKEQARKDLLLSNYTEAIWKIDLHNLFHFLSLRMDSHAQKEMRDYANVIGEKIIAPIFPLAWEAFNDFDPHRNARTLSAPDIKVVQRFGQCRHAIPAPVSAFFTLANEATGWPKPPAKNRERDECLVKLQHMGLVSTQTEEE